MNYDASHLQKVKDRLMSITMMSEFFVMLTCNDDDQLMIMNDAMEFKFKLDIIDDDCEIDNHYDYHSCNCRQGHR